MNSAPRTLIVMGVAGCGKSLIGGLIAEALGGFFEDADEFHPEANKAKMVQGIPLSDEDRRPWLEALRARLLARREETGSYVLACSALKQSYRDTLRGEDSLETLQFVYLKGSREVIAQRMAARKGHFMPTSLLDSQFATLEEPDEAIIVNVAQTPDEIVREVLNHLG
jgi:gluconokinase